MGISPRSSTNFSTQDENVQQLSQRWSDLRGKQQSDLLGKQQSDVLGKQQSDLLGKQQLYL